MTTNAGLPVSDLINVGVNLEGTVLQGRSFGKTLIIGDSNVISVAEVDREYSGLDGVAGDFTVTSPEYAAAVIHFAQEPQPDDVKIGRWFRTPAAGLIRGAVLGASEELLSNFTGVANGSLVLPIDGTPLSITGLNFSGALNLNNVASILQTGIQGAGGTGAAATAQWDAVNAQFVVTSGTSGATSSVGFATPVSPAAGTDVSSILGLSAASGAFNPSPGSAAESFLACVQRLCNGDGDFYFMTPGYSVAPADADVIGAAQYVQGAPTSRQLAVTIRNPNALDPTSVTDLAYNLSQLKLTRTFGLYSSASNFEVASFTGRLSTVDFTADDAAITMMYQTLYGVTAETLTETQARTLAAKFCNMYVNYNNGQAIPQYGTNFGGLFIDEIQNTDAMQNAVQTAIFNVFRSVGTKVGQSAAGLNLIQTAIAAAMKGYIDNGVIDGTGTAVWTGGTIKNLVSQGDILPLGFKIYIMPISSQSEANRLARVGPPVQIACRLLGAIHTVPDCLINVNR